MGEGYLFTSLVRYFGGSEGGDFERKVARLEVTYFFYGTFGY